MACSSGDKLLPAATDPCSRQPDSPETRPQCSDGFVSADVVLRSTVARRRRHRHVWVVRDPPDRDGFPNYSALGRDPRCNAICDHLKLSSGFHAVY